MLERFGVEMLGARPDSIEKAEDRALFKAAMEKIGLTCPRAGVAHSVEEARAIATRHGLPRDPPAELHDGRLGRRHRVHAGRVRREGRLGARAVADARVPHRGERPRVEGVRARGHARPGGQLHRRLLDREPRPDGRAHGRLDHRRAGDDADRPRVPAPARRGARGHDRDRRRDGRRERAVLGRPRSPGASTSSR